MKRFTHNTGRKIQAIGLDGADEYEDKTVATLHKIVGIVLQYSYVYDPKSNGRPERLV